MSQTWGFCNSEALLSQVSRGKYECVSTRRKDFNALKKLVLWKIKTKQNTKMLEWVLKRVIQSRHWSHLLNEWEASINHWVLMKERSTTTSRHCFGGHVFFLPVCWHQSVWTQIGPCQTSKHLHQQQHRGKKKKHGWRWSDPWSWSRE